jgi:hypothetical protein
VPLAAAENSTGHLHFRVMLHGRPLITVGS